MEPPAEITAFSLAAYAVEGFPPIRAIVATALAEESRNALLFAMLGRFEWMENEFTEKTKNMHSTTMHLRFILDQRDVFN